MSTHPLLTLGLIPLDERPANTRYPRQIARIAGAEVHIPPPEALSRFRTPAPHDALADWLTHAADRVDALIVSCEMLGYGGLIASRITDDPAEAVLARLDLLRTLKRRRPTLPILGFNVITRIARHDDATEEPLYWAQYGAALFRLSQFTDRAAQGQPVAAELARLQAAIPAAVQADFTQRRARNHRVNRAALDLLAAGVFDLLVLSSDDTSEYGLASREKRALTAQADALGLGERLLMYPGADEVGCVLTARLIAQAAGVTPRVAPVYLVPGGERIVAAFEDCPVSTTVERQVRAAGGISESDATGADVLLAVNPPLAPDADWVRAYTPAERAERLPPLRAALGELAAALDRGQAVAVADVAHANGADGAFFDLLRADLDLTRLASYAAWNTAGNTIGTALAQAIAAQVGAGDAPGSAGSRIAQQIGLAHRYLEDWGYQSRARQEVRQRLVEQTGSPEPSPDRIGPTSAWIAERLAQLATDLPGFERVHLVPGSVRLPWQRTFEVDFEVALS